MESGKPSCAGGIVSHACRKGRGKNGAPGQLVDPVPFHAFRKAMPQAEKVAGWGTEWGWGQQVPPFLASLACRNDKGLLGELPDAAVWASGG